MALSAQEENDIPKDIRIEMPKFSIRLNAGIPNITSNEAFRKKFIGIYEAGLSLNINLTQKTFLGIGYENGLLSASNRVDYGINTKMEMNSVYGKLGYNHFHTSLIFSTFSIAAGQNQSRFVAVKEHNGIVPDNRWSAWWMEPAYSINFYAEENLTLGFYTSVCYLNRPFKPEQVNFQHYANAGNLNSSNNTVLLNIGLEMYIGIGKKKK